MSSAFFPLRRFIHLLTFLGNKVLFLRGNEFSFISGMAKNNPPVSFSLMLVI